MPLVKDQSANLHNWILDIDLLSSTPAADLVAWDWNSLVSTPDADNKVQIQRDKVLAVMTL